MALLILRWGIRDVAVQNSPLSKENDAMRLAGSGRTGPGMQFSLKTMMLCMAIVALAMGWWLDRWKMQQELTRLRELSLYAKSEFHQYISLPELIGRKASEIPQIERWADATIVPPSPLLNDMPAEISDNTVFYYFRTVERRDCQTGYFVQVTNDRIKAVFLKKGGLTTQASQN